MALELSSSRVVALSRHANARPKSDDYTVVAIDSTTIGQDLLPTLNKKHRLQLFQDQYVLKISEAERERLDLASDEIDMQTKLRPLNLHEVTLATSTSWLSWPSAWTTCLILDSQTITLVSLSPLLSLANYQQSNTPTRRRSQ